jgi:hypothetical protein
MINDKSRAAFEVWLEKDYYGYTTHDERTMWLAWQASREVALSEAPAEPTGERAELVARLRDYDEDDNNKQAMSDAADMLEADGKSCAQTMRMDDARLLEAQKHTPLG